MEVELRSLEIVTNSEGAETKDHFASVDKGEKHVQIFEDVEPIQVDWVIIHRKYYQV